MYEITLRCNKSAVATQRDGLPWLPENQSSQNSSQVGVLEDLADFTLLGVLDLRLRPLPGGELTE